MNHSYFGELNTDIESGTDVIWERDLDLNGRPTKTALWADRGQTLDLRLVDAFAVLLQDLVGLDLRARTHLLESLEADDEFITYIPR